MILLIAFFLGIVGYLPPSIVNITVVQLAINHSKKNLIGFIAFVSFMEFVYCFGSMLGMNWILQNISFINTLKWVSVFIFFIIGIACFLDNSDGADVAADIWKGTIITLFNPYQLPFWLITGTYLFNHNLIEPSHKSIFWFSFINCLGTILVLVIYATKGKSMVEKLQLNRLFLNRTIGVITLTLAVYQTIELLR